MKIENFITISQWPKTEISTNIIQSQQQNHLTATLTPLKTNGQVNQSQKTVQNQNKKN